MVLFGGANIEDTVAGEFPRQIRRNNHMLKCCRLEMLEITMKYYISETKLWCATDKRY